MVVLVTWKSEEGPIKMKALEWPQDYICRFFRRPSADNSVVSGEILLNFGFIQAFMHVLNTCKNEYDRIKNEGARVAIRFLPLLISQSVIGSS